MYGELRCLKKPFTRFKTFPNIQNSYHNSAENYAKMVFTMLDRSRGIEHQSKALFDQLNKNRASIESGKSFRSFFLINSIDQIKVSTDWTSWNLNFHKENSRSRNSILFILQINTLQPFIVIITYPCIYLYIRHQPYENTSENWTIEVVCNSFSTLRLILNHIIQMWKVIRVTFLHDHYHSSTLLVVL